MPFLGFLRLAVGEGGGKGGGFEGGRDEGKKGVGISLTVFQAVMPVAVSTTRLYCCFPSGARMPYYCLTFPHGAWNSAAGPFIFLSFDLDKVSSTFPSDRPVLLL